MKALCIIPARGGSKRIPRKNVRPFCGKPMIAWSITAAREAGVFDRILVSTDDPEIAALAETWGAEAPFVRPAELADDHAPTVPVIRHAIAWCEAQGIRSEYVCQVLPTAPLLASVDLRAGLTVLETDASLEFALGVARYDFPIFRALRLDKAGRVSMFWPENELMRSQDLPAAYHDAGQFVWGRREAWMTRDRVFSARSQAIVLPSERVQDIDTPEDWQLAELKFEALAGACVQ